MQKRGRDRRRIELQVGEYSRDLERMGEIGVAGGALLRAMRLHGEDIGLIENGLVRAGIIGAHLLDEGRLPHQRLVPDGHNAPPARDVRSDPTPGTLSP